MLNCSKTWIKRSSTNLNADNEVLLITVPHSLIGNGLVLVHLNDFTSSLAYHFLFSILFLTKVPADLQSIHPSKEEIEKWCNQC